ncbi:Transcriptional activatory protein BadR [Pseudovibrio sp. Ad5]|uniref:MarR family winged helix-turn-helix transcriptional regulator n=1 Tax=Pseudovibrio sp. Ad5 TaxID=989436 RepID=UPI0007AE8379|nr:MarR family transcriptional regulator [Pseudovibrio sp. Ad5]KZK97967.1 Transcriptional activatory protein BadR [Pseudovibrio sp. Ad5]
MKTYDEIETEAEDKLASRVWFHLMRAHRYLYPRFERSLRTHGIDNPVWYEILLEVERAGEQGAKASDLQDHLHMAQFSMSRHIARMEKKGLIERRPDKEDGRAQLIFLTPQAAHAHEEIWPHYFKIIQQEVGERLTKKEAFELFKLLTKLYE